MFNTSAEPGTVYGCREPDHPASVFDTANTGGECPVQSQTVVVCLEPMMRCAIRIHYLFCYFCLSAAGCGESPPTQGKSGPPTMINPNQARTALIELVEQRKDDKMLQGTLGDLKTAKIEWRTSSVFTLGNWHCDSSDLSFVVNFDNPRLMLEYNGTFEYVDGRWRAKIVGSRQSQPKD